MSNHNLPSPEEMGISIPVNLNPESYMAGFQHGLTSNTLTAGQMKLSFRMGFRAAKLYLREAAKKAGKYEPQNWQFATRVPTE